MAAPEQGRHGLWYVARGMFVAAHTRERAVELWEAAMRGGDVPGHWWMPTESGGRVCAPDWDWQTPAQQEETERRLKAFLRENSDA
jgi:hypothetical protein